MNAPRISSSVCALLVLAACERSSGKYDALDQPAPPFVALGPATPLEQLPKISELAAAKEKRPEPPADACGRGSGRDPNGDCVPLGLKELEFVQRVQIPGGEFVMGALPGDYRGLPATERAAAAVMWSGQPPRHATLPSFWIDLHEVTRAAYAACVAAGACSPAICPAGQVDPATETAPELVGVLPQGCVTHAQAQAYCAHTGGRLPSEAEWEYAARGVDARVYPWGNKIEDQIPNAIYPAGHVREDSSYFGIRGLGSNVTEWVAEVYDADAGLRPFLTGEFRDPDGPLQVARAAYERRAACGDEPGCTGPSEPPPRHVIKHFSAGERAAGRDVYPARYPGKELEGWVVGGVGAKLGFRCVADLAADEQPLRVPSPAATVPLYRVQGSLQIFGGVAEVVSQAEARRFCAALQVPDGSGPALTGWRLPLRAELGELAPSFRGPGPFWAEDGAVAQVSDQTPVPPDAPWEGVEVEAGAPLLARCVRASG